MMPQVATEGADRGWMDAGGGVGSVAGGEPNSAKSPAANGPGGVWALVRGFAGELGEGGAGRGLWRAERMQGVLKRVPSQVMSMFTAV
jgi:hypothetical protein